MFSQGNSNEHGDISDHGSSCLSYTGGLLYGKYFNSCCIINETWL